MGLKNARDMDGELFTRVATQANLSPRGRRWNGNDTSARNHHGLVPISESPFDIALYWRTSAAANPQLVGFYRLNLANLQAEGYIGPTKDGKVRLRFYHDTDDCIYVEPLVRPRKKLLIGKYS
jgi:hypothetical protein